MEKRVDTME